MLDKNAIIDLSDGKIDVAIFEVTDSTNAEAKRYANECLASENIRPKLFIAREQTMGRGRMGRTFLSRADSGIYMSLLYFTSKPLSDAVSVTTAAATVVALAIERATGSEMKIKWVNDIYNDRGKVCGILAETLPVRDGNVAVVVGVGINTGDVDFPDDLKNIASSVGDISGKENVLISEIVKGLLAHADHPEDRSYMDEYRKRFMLMNEKVNLLQAGELVCSGRVGGVDDDGGLLFVPDGGDKTETIRSGEISVRFR